MEGKDGTQNEKGRVRIIGGTRRREIFEILITVSS